MSRKKEWTKIISAFILAAGLITLSGCAGVDKGNKTLVELKSDGQIKQTIVDDAEEDVTGEELENYVNENINAFEGTGESISVESCRVRSGKVNISLNYSSANAYAAFNNVSCFNGMVKEAYEAGYNFDRNFYALNGVKIPYFTLLSLCTDCKILILEEPVEVTLPGELYIVSDGVTVEDDGSIVIDENPDSDIPQEYQTTTQEAVYLIYKVKNS